MLFAIGLMIVFVALAIKISPKEKEEDKKEERLAGTFSRSGLET